MYSVRSKLIHIFDVRIDDDLFDTGTAVKPNMIEEKIWLLAYACTVLEGSDGKQDTSEVEPTAKALHSLHVILSKLSLAVDMTGECAHLLYAARFPVASMALLNWISRMISDPVFFESNLMIDPNSTEIPFLFDLISEMAVRFPMQRATIAKIISMNLGMYFKNTHNNSSLLATT
jgi:hypothetical protein